MQIKIANAIEKEAVEKQVVPLKHACLHASRLWADGVCQSDMHALHGQPSCALIHQLQTVSQGMHLSGHQQQQHAEGDEGGESQLQVEHDHGDSDAQRRGYQAHDVLAQHLQGLRIRRHKVEHAAR